MNKLEKNNEIALDLENIVNTLQMFHFSGELEFNKKCLEGNINDEIVDGINTDGEIVDGEIVDGVNNNILRIEKLDTILSNLKNKSNNTNIKDKKKDFFAKIDTLVFKQPWKNLSSFHKNIKISEYVADICSKINDDKNKLKELEKLICESNLTNKYVNYDQINSKIIDISNLSFDKENNKWKLNLKYKKPKAVKKDI